MSWIQATVGDVCVPTLQRTPASDGGSFRYIDIAGIDRNAKVIATANALPCNEAPSRARKEVKADDVLVSTVRPNLNAVAQVPPDLDGEIASTGFAVLRADRALLHPRYLFYRVQHQEFIDALVTNATGASYPAVSDAIVRRTLLPLPPLSEQRRIIEILDQADALRKLRREADAKAARILPTLFLKMFGDPATNPMDWPTATIGDITTLVTSGLTPRGGAGVYVNRGPMLIRSQNVLMNRLDLSGVAHITKETHAQMRRTHVELGDVLLNLTGASIGRVAWVRHLDGEANVNQHVCILRPNEKLVEPSFLSTCLSLPYHQSTITGVQTGASRQALNHQQVRRLEIALPSRNKQREFAQREVDLHEMNKSRFNAHSELHTLFDILLQRAFSGQLTAKWRQAHMQELLVEMLEQARLLNLPAPN